MSSTSTVPAPAAPASEKTAAPQTPRAPRPLGLMRALTEDMDR